MFGAVVQMFLDAFLRPIFVIFFLLVGLELNVCEILIVGGLIIFGNTFCQKSFDL